MKPLHSSRSGRTVFPGDNAGASLKQADSLSVNPEESVFPGDNAGASLKLSIHPQDRRRMNGLPR